MIDTSRSMLARSSPAARDPLHAGDRRRPSLPQPPSDDVPVGIASFTDRVLPHLFPSLDDDVFVSHPRPVDRDRPPAAARLFSSTATRLTALETIISAATSRPTVRKRLIFVSPTARAFRSQARGSPRLPPPARGRHDLPARLDARRARFRAGRPEPQYAPDPRSRASWTPPPNARRPVLRRGPGGIRDREARERSATARRSSAASSRTGSRSRPTSPG